jgi:hypothetical protein
MKDKLKEIDIKKLGLGVLFIVMSFVFFFLNNFTNSDNQNGQSEIVNNTKTDNFQGEEKPKRFIDPEDLDDYVMKAFLQELVGHDYTLLVNLFPTELLDKNVDEMDEVQFNKYAQEVGQKIKEGKDLVKARVLTYKSLENGGSEYQIELEFRDGNKKLIELVTNDGKIATHINDLY